jgi:hypothetical protein
MVQASFLTSACINPVADVCESIVEMISEVSIVESNQKTEFFAAKPQTLPAAGRLPAGRLEH